MMEQFSPIFEGVNDPRKSNATRHDLQEMLRLVADLAQDLEGVIAPGLPRRRPGARPCAVSLLPRVGERCHRSRRGLCAGPQEPAPDPDPGATVKAGSMRGKLKKAGWNDDFILDMIRAAKPAQKR